MSFFKCKAEVNQRLRPAELSPPVSAHQQRENIYDDDI